MKNLLFIAIAIFGFSAVSFGQTAATATVGAEIMAPITLTAPIGLEFGKLSVQQAIAGEVTLTAAAATVASPANGVTLIAGTPRTAAKFHVTGIISHSYSIQIPTGDITIKDGGGTGTNSMIVNTFTSYSVQNAATSNGVLDGSGLDDFYVGATLNVKAAQAPAVYSGSFPVTVNYN